ncbi:MAG: carbamoyltransferase C-terminal domain-containing protein, partial [Candidatus Omnitrophota bacterium]
MKILGLHIKSHDTAVAYLQDNKVKYIVGNERLSRIKMDGEAPILALRRCLQDNHIQAEELNIVATAGARIFPKMKEELRGFKGKFRFVSHHLSYLSSAYYLSGWRECLVGVIGGTGSPQAMAFYKAKNGKFELLAESLMPHSAGNFYALITIILGFDPYRHPGKITGLAAYGNPDIAYAKVKALLGVDGLALRLNYPLYRRCLDDYRAHKRIPPYFSGCQPQDLAAAFQKRLEECILEILSQVVKATGLRNIALAGGVTANVRLNQKISELKEIDEVYIHPGMGDVGLALGAALYVAAQQGYTFTRLQNLFLGPEYSKKEIELALKKSGLRYKKIERIEEKAAELLSEGKVVARFAGRLEYGPRALGNRSILYQTTDTSVNDWLNKKLRRSEFMPFAPVTLAEFADKCYQNIDGNGYTAKFMTITFNSTDYMQKVSPAVVHIDGTARPQILSKEDNPRFYKILKSYHKLTGIPNLINTSFNIHEEPIVCSAD